MMNFIKDLFVSPRDPRLDTVAQMFDGVEENRTQSLRLLHLQDMHLQARMWRVLSLETEIAYNTPGILAYSPPKQINSIKTALKAMEVASDYRVQLALLQLRECVESDATYIKLLEESQRQFFQLRIDPKMTEVYTQVLSLGENSAQVLSELKSIQVWYESLHQRSLVTALEKTPLPILTKKSSPHCIPNHCSLAAWQVHRAIQGRALLVSESVEKEADRLLNEKTIPLADLGGLPTHSLSINSPADPAPINKKFRNCGFFSSISSFIWGAP